MFVKRYNFTFETSKQLVSINCTNINNLLRGSILEPQKDGGII